MKISVASANFFNLGRDSDDEIKAGFKRMKAVGFDAVDIDFGSFCDRAGFISGDVGDFFSAGEDEKAAKVSKIKSFADEAGIVFSQMHAPFPTYIKDNDSANSRLHSAIVDCIKACRVLGCPHVVVHPVFFQYDEKMEPDEEWDANIRFYSSFIDIAKENGVKICLENMFVNFKGHIIGACCSDTYEAVGLIDELNETAGENIFAFCLDIGHLNLIGKNIYNAILELSDCIEALHIHDNYGVHDNHDVPYSGNIDWDAFIKGMRAIEYKGNLSFETGVKPIEKYPEPLRDMALRSLAETGNYFREEILK